MIYKDISKDYLKAIQNPNKEDYDIKVKIPEFTFLGIKDQPDFTVILQPSLYMPISMSL